jgi:hypothetical protein
LLLAAKKLASVKTRTMTDTTKKGEVRFMALAPAV